MSVQKSNLRFIVKNNHCENFLFTITASVSIIHDIEDAIYAFSEKHKELIIEKDNIGFSLNPKAYMAIQHIIYEKIQ